METKTFRKFLCLVIVLLSVIPVAGASGDVQNESKLVESADDLFHYILDLSFRILTGEIGGLSPDNTFRQDWEDNTEGFEAGLGSEGCSSFVDEYVESAQSSYYTGYDALNAGIIQLLGFHDYPTENQEKLINSYLDQAEQGFLDAEDYYNRAREGCSVTSSNLFTFNMVENKLEAIVDDFYYIKINALYAIECGNSNDWDSYDNCIEDVTAKLKTLNRVDNEIQVLF